MAFEIRPYQPSDLIWLYRICLGTGNSGSDGSHLYQDPDIIGHYYAAPYGVLEPDLAFILTHNERPCGYVLGAHDTATFGQRCEEIWFPLLRKQYPLPAETDQSRDANMIRAIHRGHELTNEFPDYPAHLHIDILPEGQGQGWGRKMIETLLAQMQALTIGGVHLGVGKKNTNAIGFYEHVGFHKVKEYDTATVYGTRLI